MCVLGSVKKSKWVQNHGKSNISWSHKLKFWIWNASKYSKSCYRPLSAWLPQNSWDLCFMVLKTYLGLMSCDQQKKAASTWAACAPRAFLSHRYLFLQLWKEYDQVQLKISSLSSRQNLFYFSCNKWRESSDFFNTVITRGVWSICQVMSSSTFRWKEKEHSQTHLGNKVIGAMRQFK